MDFTFTDEQQAILDLSHRILSEQLPPERLRELELAAGADGSGWYADDVWAALATADLLGLALPESVGGGGYGFLEACLVAESVGRTVAPVPYLSCILGAALAVAEHGSPEQQARWLPGVVDGTSTLSVGLTGDVVATPAGDGWSLRGQVTLVPGADRAAAVVLPARTGATGTTVVLVAPTAAGVTLRPEVAVSGEPQWTVHLDGAEVGPGDVLGAVGDGAAVAGWIADRLIAGACATQTGVCEEALAITARYVCEREQFGTRLGTFQAVGHRIADAYIDTEAIRLTALQAIWRLDRGLPAEAELMTAKFWTADGAQRVVHAAQHLHGGIGVDLDYPIHRYFRWAKVLELALGGASESLLRLGARLADQPVGSA